MTDGEVERGHDCTVRLLRDDDIEVAAGLLARAFAHDAVLCAALPDPEQRERISTRFMAHELRTCLPTASCYGVTSSGTLAGVALWYPPHTRPASLPSTLRLAVELATEARTVLPAAPRLLRVLGRDAAALSRMATQRQAAFQAASQPPATYLALLATDPAHRGQGIARRLLEHMLHRCDQDGVAAWLHTTDPVNLGFYARFGWSSIAHLGGGRLIPDLWVLRREPADRPTEPPGERTR